MDYDSIALPLSYAGIFFGRRWDDIKWTNQVIMAGSTGLEPATFGVTSRRSKPTELRAHLNLISLLFSNFRTVAHIGNEGLEPPTPCV